MKRIFTIFYSAALSLAACGQGTETISANSSASKDSASSPVATPHFQTTGQSFFLSTGCSPHSVSVNLQVTARAVVVTTGADYGDLRTITLDYLASSVIDTVGQFGAGHEWHTVTTNLTQAKDPAGYRKVVADLLANVRLVQVGNTCFPAHPELGDLVDYLQTQQ